MVVTEQHMEYNNFCRARWGVSGALLPATRYSRVECVDEASFDVVWALHKLLRVGSHATESYEPRQVRKEAAVSGQTV